MRPLHALLVASTAFPFAVAASQDPARVAIDTIARELGQGAAMVFVAPDSAVFGSYRGEIRYIDLRNGQHRRIAGGPRGLVRGEAGLRDLALHPGFATNRWLYVSLVVGDTADNTLAVWRGRLVGDSLRDSSTVFVTVERDHGHDHYGGQVVFANGYLFISNGDRQNRERVPNLAWHHGKILRLHDDGRVPDDNPFVGRPGARPEIWTFGHRNVQGMAYDSARGILWANEHGPRHGDELNRIERGRDYGWPRVSFGWEYTGGPIGTGIPVDSVTPVPDWVWSPNVAPSGLMVYSGRAFPEWRGNIFSGTMHAVRGRHLNRLAWDGQRFVLEERLYTPSLGRVRFVEEDARGWIYLGNDDGFLVRLRPR